jgi:hypothetical protein
VVGLASGGVALDKDRAVVQEEVCGANRRVQQTAGVVAHVDDQALGALSEFCADGGLELLGRAAGELPDVDITNVAHFDAIGVA